MKFVLGSMYVTGIYGYVCYLKGTKTFRRSTVLSFFAAFIIISNVHAESSIRSILDDADKAVVSHDISHVRKVLSQISDESPILRQCETNGIAFGVPYFLIKSFMLENGNHIADTLESLRTAEAYLECSKCPTNKTLAAAYTDSYNTYLAKIYLSRARNARKIGKNYTASQCASKILTLSDIPDELVVDATLELAQLYRDQGRFKLFYSVCTSLHDRASILTKQAFVIKADAEFHANKNNEAFTDLLAVLYTDGIQEIKPGEDPALALFLRNIGRANREDILSLYDALKAQLDYEKLVKGKEKLIAFLIQERMLLAKIYPYLDKQTDADIMSFTSRIERENILKKARDKSQKRIKQLEKVK